MVEKPINEQACDDEDTRVEKPIDELGEREACHDEDTRVAAKTPAKDTRRRWNRAKAMPNASTSAKSDSGDGFRDVHTNEATTHSKSCRASEDSKAEQSFPSRTGCAKAKPNASTSAKADSDDGFWDVHTNEATTHSEPCRGSEESKAEQSVYSKTDHEREVRKLQKALREIGALELQLQMMGNLRKNQLDKIAKKQEYIDKLQQLGSSLEAQSGA